MKLLIVGSRSITDYDISPHIPAETELIISGGANGVDTLAENMPTNTEYQSSSCARNTSCTIAARHLSATTAWSSCAIRLSYSGTVYHEGRNTLSTMLKNWASRLRSSLFRKRSCHLIVRYLLVVAQ